MVNDTWDAVYTEMLVPWLGVLADVRREFVPVAELKDLTTLTISVLATGEIVERLTRTAFVRRPEIRIVVQQRVATENEKQDLLDLCDAIVTHFLDNPAGVASVATCLQAEKNPLFSSEHLEQYRVFASVIVLRYRGRT